MKYNNRFTKVSCRNLILVNNTFTRLVSSSMASRCHEVLPLISSSSDVECETNGADNKIYLVRLDGKKGCFLIMFNTMASLESHERKIHVSSVITTNG